MRAVVIATMLLGGCTASLVGEDGGAPDRAVVIGGRCEVACEMLTQCVNGRCDPYPPCSGAGTCVDGYVCQRRRCIPADRDLDGDAVVAGLDCDETSPAVYPGATEDCNAADDDCDGSIDEEVAERACSSACGGGNEQCAAGAWSGCTAVAPMAETCNAIDDDCNSRIDDGLVRGCTTACGSGSETCVGGRWSNCTAQAPIAEACNQRDDDCNGVVDDVTRPCATACGGGIEACVNGTWGACSARVPQPESCNLGDDDCNGRCDEAGCRVGVHRSLNTQRLEHFYTTNAAEAACCTYSVEAYNYYWIYASPIPGLVPLYRCVLLDWYRIYTTDPDCEGVGRGAVEGVMGYVAQGPGACGSVPLYHLTYGRDHLYVHSDEERDLAIGGGWYYHGAVAYVWRGPDS